MKDFFRKHKIKKSFRVVIFFIAIICLSFGGYTVCKLLFDGNTGSYWNGEIASSFHSGSGTDADPYIVSNASQFAYLQNGCKNNVYIRLNNDIYLNEGDIEKEEDNYYLYVGNDKYNLDINTGVATKGLSSRTLQKYNSTTNETSCHIDGNNHTVYGLYIQNDESASFLHDFTGTIDNLYFQSSLINGATASLIKNTQDSSYNDIYFGGYLASSGEVSTTQETLYNQILMDATGASSASEAKSIIEAKGTPNFRTTATTDEGMYKTTDDDGDAYYYRGDINYNHVIFGKRCWEIVRTTGTDGVKLVYDGLKRLGSNGKSICPNTTNNWVNGGTYSDATSTYHSTDTGYMYGSNNWLRSDNITTKTTNIIFSNDVTYNSSTNKYQLVTSDSFTMVPSNWGSSDASLNYTNVAQRHYTCLNDSLSCSKVYYVYDVFGTSSISYIELSNGKLLNDFINESFVNPPNSINSNAKSKIDNWYRETLLDYESYIEDAIYCNDREISSYGGWDKDASNIDNHMEFSANQRLRSSYNPTLICNRLVDKFTVSSDKGNGKLTCPVGLLTADEISMAGAKYNTSNSKLYLYVDDNKPFWTMTGASIFYYMPLLFYLTNGNLNVSAPSGNYLYRPVITLKPGILVVDGDGTVNNPYIINTELENPVIQAYSSLIGESSNSTYNRIKFEGALEAEYSASGLIKSSSSDTITNFEINVTSSSDEFSSIVEEGNSNISNGYIKGSITANTVNTFNTNTGSYQKVAVLGNANASTIEKSCNGTCSSVYQSLSSGTNYASENSIISNLNSSLPLLYWKTTSGKLPELLISSDNIEPVISIKITTKNTSNQTVNTNYNSFKSNRGVITSSSAPSVTINSITEDTTFKTVQYYVGNGSPLTTAELDELNESSWTDYSDTFTTSDKGSYIYYFKVVDINNNVVYISSDYIVYDKITASYYNVDSNATLSSGSLNKNKTLKVVYSTEGNSLESNYNAAEYKLNVQGIPVGTIISFKGPANSYGERLVYTYKVTGSTGASIKLSDFKLSGTSTATNYDSSNLNIEGSGLEVYYNFRDTVGGTFNTTLGLSDNTNLILQDLSPITINITSTTDSISLSNNQSSTMALNSVENHNIRYTATSSNQEGYYYLKFNILDSNNNIVDSSLMKGLSIVYSSKEYLPDNSGTITIPIGTFKSTIDVTLKVNYLTNDKPGTFFIGAKLYKKEASSSYNKFSISTNYINNNTLEQLIEIKRNNNLAISPGDTLTFSVSDYTQDSNVGSISFNTYIELYKKNFPANTYSSMRLSNASSTSFMESSGFEVMYPNAGAANINIQFKDTLSPGTYKLDVRIKNGSATIKTESLYFVVVGG